MHYALLILLIVTFQQEPFKTAQLKKPRVKSAYEEKELTIKNLFEAKGLSWKKYQLFIRAFKKEKVLETWVRSENENSFRLLETYSFCASSGILGPKRKEGDLQIPEGIYHVNHFNPESNFHLSLGINYPNQSDKILADRNRPGSAIYIHGNCVTIGCIPITDDKIKELYILAVEARSHGQHQIPVHIFPCRMNELNMKELVNENVSAQIQSFWQNLKPLHDDFENTKRLKKITVDNRGQYSLTSEVI